jgi:Kef-type K+ transport system membrane component KefB
MIQLLAFVFGRIKQPRVIAEVIGGVFLGPTGALHHLSYSSLSPL